MADELHIIVIEGTTRVQRETLPAAKLIASIGNEIPGVHTTLVDPNDLNLPGDGNDPEGKDANYTDLCKRADGFFVLVPEYNHSFPGSLKRVLDSELEHYLHKPIALAGASSGGWGGVRAVESLVPAVREMGLVVTHMSPYFPRVQDLFKDDGSIKDAKYIESVKRAYKELIWMATVLKYGRDHIT